MDCAEGELLERGARQQVEGELQAPAVTAAVVKVSVGSASRDPLGAIPDAIGIGGGFVAASLYRVDADGALEVADHGPAIVPGASTSGMGPQCGVDRELSGRMGRRLLVEAGHGARARAALPPVRPTDEATA